MLRSKGHARHFGKRARDPSLARSHRIDDLPQAQRVAYNFTAMAVSTIGVGLMSVAVVHLAAQALGPSRYGELVTVQAVVAMFSLLADLGVTLVTARDLAADPSEAPTIVNAALGFRLLLCLSMTPVLIGVAYLLYGHRHEVIVVGVIIMSLDIFAVAIQMVGQAYWASRQRNDIPSLMITLGKAVYLGLAFLAAQSAHSMLLFIAGYVAADCLICLAVLIGLSRNLRIRPTFSLTGAREMVIRSVPIGATQIVNRFYSRADTFLLSLLRAPAVVAQYGVAFNVTDVLGQLPSFLMTALLPSLVEGHKTGDLEGRLQSALEVVFWFALPITVVGILLRGPIVEVVAGPGYGPSDAPLAVLMLTVLVSFPQAVCVWGCLASGRLQRLLPRVILSLVLNVGLNLVLIPPFGADGSAEAQLITETLSMLLTYLILRRDGGVRLRVRPLGRMTAAAAVSAGLVAAFLRIAPSNSAARLVLGGAVAGVGYLAVSSLAHANPAAVSDALHGASHSRPSARTEGESE